MVIPIIVLVVSAVFFAIGKVRSDLVALCALLVLVLTHTLTPTEALAGFSNPVVVMMAGLFVVGGGILQSGLAKMISGRIMGLAGNSNLRLFLMVMIVTAVIGGFVSNTGTVALMLPIVVSIAASTGTNASTLLMPLAFASSMGGMLTLIGTPPQPCHQRGAHRCWIPRHVVLLLPARGRGVHCGRHTGVAATESEILEQAR